MKRSIRLIMSVIFVFILISNASGTTINADEALKRIGKGETLDNYEINGDLNLNSSFNDYPFSITNSNINGSINSQNLKFNKDFIIINCTIRGYSDFNNTQFNRNSHFFMTNFINGSYFVNSTFGEDANFYKCKFYIESLFCESKFIGKALFGSVVFDCRPDFWSAEFGMDAEFKGSKFAEGGAFRYITCKKMNCEQAQFYDDAVFEGAIIQDVATFHNSSLTSINFNNAEFNKLANFADAQFNGQALFEKVVFSDALNVENSRFTGDFSLNGSNIEKDAEFKGASFSPHIYLNNVKFNSRLRVTWDQIKDNLTGDGSTYTFLIKNFKELEQFKDADNCYFKFRWEELSKKKWLDGSKYLDLLSLISSGFGVRLIYTVILSLSLVFIFAFWYSLGNFKEAIYFSTSVFLQLQAKGEQYETMEAFHKYAIIIERLLGWSLMAVFIVVLNYRLGIGLI